MNNRILRYALRVWGWLCLLFAVIYLVLTIWAAGGSDRNFYPGFSTGPGEWIGMGLISLGLSRLLDEK